MACRDALPASHSPSRECCPPGKARAAAPTPRTGGCLQTGTRRSRRRLAVHHELAALPHALLRRQLARCTGGLMSSRSPRSMTRQRPLRQSATVKSRPALRETSRCRREFPCEGDRAVPDNSSPAHWAYNWRPCRRSRRIESVTELSASFVAVRLLNEYTFLIILHEEYSLFCRRGSPTRNRRQAHLSPLSLYIVLPSFLAEYNVKIHRVLVWDCPPQPVAATGTGIVIGSTSSLLRSEGAAVSVNELRRAEDHERIAYLLLAHRIPVTGSRTCRDRRAAQP